MNETSSIRLLNTEDQKILLERADRNFPWLEADEYFDFNEAFGESGYIEHSQDDELITGGNLSPGMILSAYRCSFFPWFSEEEPITWFSPSVRFVITGRSFHIPSRLKREIKNSPFTITYNKAFDAVIENCACVKRKFQNGTWITNDMIAAYKLLHKLNIAVSVEAWKENELAGGFYGLWFGNVFVGESMFTKTSGASKTAFALFAENFFFRSGGTLIDAQIPSENIGRFGGIKIPRNAYLKLLSKTQDCY